MNASKVLLRATLCADDARGAWAPTPFRALAVRDLYFGYWGDPVLARLSEIARVLNGSFSAYSPGIEFNASTADAARYANGVDETRTGRGSTSARDIGTYVAWQNMTEARAALARRSYRETLPLGHSCAHTRTTLASPLHLPPLPQLPRHTCRCPRHKPVTVA